VEQEIFAARERRLANAAKRREEASRHFADLCEATGGLAVAWRRRGTPFATQLAWAVGDVFALQCLARYHGRQASREIDRLRHQLKRPLYYAAENARRRAMAESRRKVHRRTTENPCPTREAILDAWIARRSSHEAAIRFGSLIEDLECYLDNKLIRSEDGIIVGRCGGIKHWLQTEIPALYLRYTTVMRCKAAAKKLRQIAEIRDPVPASRIVDDKLPAPQFILRARAIWREVAAGAKSSPTSLMDRINAFLDPERVEEANMLAEWRERYNSEITVRTKDSAEIRDSRKEVSGLLKKVVGKVKQRFSSGKHV